MKANGTRSTSGTNDARAVRGAGGQAKRGKALRWVLAVCAVLVVAVLAVCLTGTGARLLGTLAGPQPAAVAESPIAAGFSPGDVAPYAGEPSVAVNGGEPFFADDDLKREPFEMYSDLDALGRCGPAFALVGPETMPSASRGSIGMIKPTGWQIAQ